MPQRQGPSSSHGGRIAGDIQNTAPTSASFVLGAGWGASTLAVAAGSTDQRGQFTITCATGGGLSQATATIVFTFADGAFAAAPFAFVTSTNDNSIDTGRATWSSTTTALTLTFSLLPVTTKIYKFNYALVA